LLLEHVDTLDVRATRPLLTERDEALDRLGVALENSFEGAVRVVSRPPGDAALLGRAPCRIAEEDALDPAVDDRAPPDHSGRRAVDAQRTTVG
jgi:hypothetical protein